VPRTSVGGSRRCPSRRHCVFALRFAPAHTVDRRGPPWSAEHPSHGLSPQWRDPDSNRGGTVPMLPLASRASHASRPQDTVHASGPAVGTTLVPRRSAGSTVLTPDPRSTARPSGRRCLLPSAPQPEDLGIRGGACRSLGPQHDPASGACGSGAFGLWSCRTSPSPPAWTLCCLPLSLLSEHFAACPFAWGLDREVDHCRLLWALSCLPSPPPSRDPRPGASPVLLVAVPSGSSRGGLRCSVRVPDLPAPSRAWCAR
jgi:hypothetical protein